MWLKSQYEMLYESIKTTAQKIFWGYSTNKCSVFRHIFLSKYIKKWQLSTWYKLRVLQSLKYCFKTSLHCIYLINHSASPSSLSSPRNRPDYSNSAIKDSILQGSAFRFSPCMWIAAPLLLYSSCVQPQ